MPFGAMEAFGKIGSNLRRGPEGQDMFCDIAAIEER